MIYVVEEMRWATVTELMGFQQKGIPFAEWGIKGHNRPYILENGGFQRGMRVAEVGGAYSELPEHIATTYGCEVSVIDDFGVESGEPLWSRWGNREDLKEKNSHVNYIFERVGNIDSNNIPLGYFDVVYSVSTLEHIPPEKIGRAFVHMAEMLKVGGTMIHCIDCRIPLTPHRKPNWLSVVLGTVGCAGYHSLRNIFSTRNKPNLHSILGWKSFVKRILRPCTFGKTPGLGFVSSSINPDIVVEPPDVVFKFYPPNNTVKRYTRNGTFVLIIKKSAA